MRIRLGTINVPEEARFALGREIDGFGDEVIPADHSFVRDYLVSICELKVQELVKKELEFNKDFHLDRLEKLQKKAKRYAERAAKQEQKMLPFTNEDTLTKTGTN